MTPLPGSLRQLLAGARTLLVLTVLLGLCYPLAMTGLAQGIFHDNANGSLATENGRVVGSDLVGQAFTRPRTRDGHSVHDTSGASVLVPDPAYFQSRPSAAGTGYDPRSSSASNLALDNPVLVRLVEQRRAVAAALDGVPAARVAPDAVLASGSGLDPQISPRYAEEQVPRIARVRGLPQQRVRALVTGVEQGRSLGFLGEPRVNVLRLNLALDNLARDAVGTPDNRP
jgi:K+-transporting ATPase ATPase C chain